MHQQTLELLVVYTILHDFFFFLYSFSSHLLGFSSKPYCSYYGSCGYGCFYLLFCFFPIRKNREKWMEGIKQKIFLKKIKINMQVLCREVERTMNKQRVKRIGQRKKLVAICAGLLLFIFVMFLVFPCSNFSFSWWSPLSWDQSSNPATSSFWVSPSIFLLCKVVIADSIQVFELFFCALDLFPHFLPFFV